MVCLFVYMQGEKGESGFVIAADGSTMSGLAGPMGPKGVKVIFVGCCLQDHSPHILLLRTLCTTNRCKCICVYRVIMVYQDLLEFM